MAQQLYEFEMIKKALIRDLLLRRERVVEMECALEKKREYYNSVIKASSYKQQQQKNMTFFVRCLEQIRKKHNQSIQVLKLYISFLNKMSH